MTADTTRREHSGSGIRLGIGSCPGIAKILPAGIRGITLPDGTRVRMLRCVTRENGADIPVALIPATGAVHNRMLEAAGGQIVEFAGRPRLYRPEKGGPILAFTVTDLDSRLRPPLCFEPARERHKNTLTNSVGVMMEGLPILTPAESMVTSRHQLNRPYRVGGTEYDGGQHHIGVHHHPR